MLCTLKIHGLKPKRRSLWHGSGSPHGGMRATMVGYESLYKRDPRELAPPLPHPRPPPATWEHKSAVYEPGEYPPRYQICQPWSWNLLSPRTVRNRCCLIFDIAARMGSDSSPIWRQVPCGPQFWCHAACGLQVLSFLKLSFLFYEVGSDEHTDLVNIQIFKVSLALTSQW